MTGVIKVTMDRPANGLSEDDIAEAYRGQFFHLLINGEAYMAQVTEIHISENRVGIVGDVQDPLRDPLAEASHG